MTIAKDRRNIEFKIRYWKHRLEDLQDSCAHTNVRRSSSILGEKEYNWCTCHDCGKLWLDKHTKEKI